MRTKSLPLADEAIVLVYLCAFFILAHSCRSGGVPGVLDDEMTVGPPAVWLVPPELVSDDPQASPTLSRVGAVQGLYAGNEGLVTVVATLAGPRVIFESRDEGRSWLESFRVPGPQLAHAYDPVLGEFHWLTGEASELVHHVRRPGSEDRSVAVAEIEVLATRGFVLHVARQNLGISWIDEASGWPRLTFVASNDGGRTWRPPSVVNRESRATALFPPTLFYQGGVWYAAWPENRGGLTLFDIFLSASSDGLAWSKPRRVNDDLEHAWNWTPYLAGDGARLFVGFSDYRDLNRFQDRDENVYFAQFDPVPGTVSSNIRLNQLVNAAQRLYALTYDPEKRTLMALWIDEVRRLTRDVTFSFSRDAGQSWLPSQRLNDDGAGRLVMHPTITSRPGHGTYLSWMEVADGRVSLVVRKMTGFRTRSRIVTEKGQLPTHSVPLVPRFDSARMGSPLASCDFETAAGLSQWSPVHGQWILRQGRLLGYDPHPCSIRWNGPKLADFVLEGRFRLDDAKPFNAQIFFRAGKSSPAGLVSGYSIINHFRQGVWLVRSERGFNILQAGTVLADKWFPLKGNQWYSFKLVVQDSNLDYYLENDHLLSSNQLTARSAGEIALGGGGDPVEFDQVRIWRLPAPGSTTLSRD